MPYDCESSPGDCFFASLGYALYENPNCHFEIRSAGITHLRNKPELYIESLANVSWENYIKQMSQSGTWCDHIIIGRFYTKRRLSCPDDLNSFI